MADDNKPMKYMRYAIGEIALVVIGILIALQVNNWNETRKEKKEIKELITSLISDLEEDVAMVDIILYQANISAIRLDSLTKYLYNKNILEISNLDMLCFSNSTTYRPYTWHRSTIESIINSGHLGLIENDSLSKKISEYYAFTLHLEVDYLTDISLAQKLNDLTVRVINTNYKNYKELKKVLRLYNDQGDSSYNEAFEFHSSKEYQKAKLEELDIISKNIDDFKIVVNRVIDLEENLSVRTKIELPRLKTNAKVLIELLKK